MDTLINTIQQLSRARDLNAIYSAVKTAARKLATADGATFILKEGDECHYIDEDCISPLWKGRRFAIDNCISGWCIRHKRPVIIENIAQDGRISASLYASTFVVSMALFPIRVEDPVGAIAVYWAQPHQPSHSQIKQLQVLADSTSLALENVELYEKLNQQIFERTASLLNAQQQAETAGAIKSRFLAFASHELRQPLQQLSTISTLLLNHPQDASLTQKQIHKMQRVIGNMENMLNTLLDLSQLENGKLEPRLQNFPLEPLLKTLHADFADAAGNKGLELSIGASSKQVHSDPGLLLQILSNLVGNAIKYTQAGEVRVDCRNNDTGVEILIRDTGPGIQHDQQQVIFEAFYTIEQNHQHRHRRGFGLGLAIVKGLSELLKLPITLQSAPGNGTTFSVLVPNSSGVLQARLDDDPPTLQSFRADKINILYLEDDEAIAEAIEALLTIEGYHVLNAPNSDKALALLQQKNETPDLIITDNKLFNGDTGIDAVCRIRDNAKHYIPAIMLTGLTEKALEDHALQTVQKVLHKPVDVERLLAEMRNLLSTLQA